jgi:hypothetical protein
VKIFLNRELRRIFGQKKDESKEAGEYSILRSIIICTLHEIITMVTSKRMRWTGLVTRMGTRGMHMGFW